MRTNWDYTNLATAYLDRPPYATIAIQRLLSLAECRPQARVCDVGAGIGHLTIPLLHADLCVTAVEPNDAMRQLGIKQTASWKNVSWYEGVGEATGQPSTFFDLVTFGSSFNVVDRSKALSETYRILKPCGWMACLWNHRDLNDPIQQLVEQTIVEAIPHYSYGARREDQQDVIVGSRLFENIVMIEETEIQRVNRAAWINAWRSHATLQRQAVDLLEELITKIDSVVPEGEFLNIPYTTRMWCAQKKSCC
jgi:ubiquinone/menaquinone biosynthesis C-methylase UbiE